MENGPLNNIVIENNVAHVEVSPDGGAITRFQLYDIDINPLSFAFAADQMSINNRKGAPFRGHFACIGRWGPPSPGEIKHGVPDHGDFVAIKWKVIERNESSLIMEATSDSEGLFVRRSIFLAPSAAVLIVSEEITNISALGRLFNIVQHPTIAAPFLGAGTRVFCNAANGYYYGSYNNYHETETCWPRARYPDGNMYDISKSDFGKTGVHSFIVSKTDEYGWICALSPQVNLLLGYLWERNQYPWINHWCDYHGDNIRYRGLEFGTTGMHQPFPVMLRTGNTRIFDEPVFEFIDAGETIKKSFTCFLVTANNSIDEVQGVTLNGGQIRIFSDSASWSLSC